MTSEKTTVRFFAALKRKVLHNVQYVRYPLYKLAEFHPTKKKKFLKITDSFYKFTGIYIWRYMNLKQT
jgi:hypothetical protein